MLRVRRGRERESLCVCQRSGRERKEIICNWEGDCVGRESGFLHVEENTFEVPSVLLKSIQCK